MESKQWTMETNKIHGWRILNENGSEIVRDIYDKEIAATIIRDHNGDLEVAVRQMRQRHKHKAERVGP